VALLGLFRRGSHAEAKQLEERIAALRAELSMCREMAGHRRHLAYAAAAVGAVLILAAGFTLGVYRQPIQQSIVSVAQAVGVAKSSPDVEAGLAHYQKNNYAAALRILQPLAEQGDPRAQSTLGHMYWRGRGVRRDDVEAVKWFRMGADRGDARAQFDLGNMYSEGLGVPQDHAEAAKLYRLAADQNFGQAQYNLGVWYARGEGVEQDNVMAHMWFNLAAATLPAVEGRNTAMQNRDMLAGRMTREQLMQAQKLAREWKPK
jgi:uncharacterized protein